MDKDIYRIIQEIKAKENENAKEYGRFKLLEENPVTYKGKIKTIEVVNGVDTEIEKDIFEVIEIMSEDGSIVKNYYDEKINCVAGCDKDGKMYPSKNSIAKDVNIDKKIEEIAKNPGISETDIEKEIETIAKFLGIEKEEILTLSKYDLDKKLEGKEEKNEKLKIKDDEKEKDENEEETTEKNEQILNNINSKQEIDLDKKVDDIHTLGQILGVEAGSKLIAVYSNSIENSENTTRFSFIIKKSDGTFEMADMLNQAGGRDSNKNIYEVNRDGSKVEEKSVQSSYTINSPLTKNGLLTARIGAAGYIEISYGEMDRTQHKDALTHELKTDHTKDVTYEVRQEFSYKKGTENIKDDIKELKEHEEVGHGDATLENADGDPTTGHKHLKNNEHSAYEPKEAIEEIRKYEGPNSDNMYEFNDEELEERLISLSEKYPNENLEQLIKRTQEDIAAEYLHKHEK